MDIDVANMLIQIFQIKKFKISMTRNNFSTISQQLQEQHLRKNNINQAHNFLKYLFLNQLDFDFAEIYLIVI